ncbi:MAG TPA: hypothetical protein PLQ64_01705 [Thiobacillaceae bacterium]|nr:hypothetical protein [Thiobacillaceae bacterium]
MIEVLLILAIIGIGGAFVWDAWEDDSKNPNMTLKKDDWQCTKHETRTHLQPIGKVLMPMTTEVCVEYRRIGG